MPESSKLALLERAHLWTELISKLVGAVAIVVAAWWTYTNFTVERTHDPTLEVTVVPSVAPLPDGRVLLNVDVVLRNVGKVAIAPRFTSDADSEDSGLEVSIVEMVPGAPGDGATVVPWFDWTEGDGDPRFIVQKRNLLATNEDFRNKRYQLNPGVRYREPFACIVRSGRIYAVRARFWTEEGSVVDLAYINTCIADDRVDPVRTSHGVTSSSDPLR